MTLNIQGYVSTRIEEGLHDGTFDAGHLQQLRALVGEEVSQRILDEVNRAYEAGRSIPQALFEEHQKADQEKVFEGEKAIDPSEDTYLKLEKARILIQAGSTFGWSLPEGRMVELFEKIEGLVDA